MKHIAYYRVSTRRQGISGLGLEAQRETVEAFAKSNEGTILAAYTEVESGRKSDRPKLQQAIGHARLTGATLIVAKVDRLARNVAFLSKLMESGVHFICCDNPSANELTIHILVAVAEAEAKAISERTKRALDAYRCRGGKLGRVSNLNGNAIRKGLEASELRRRENADRAYEFLYLRLIQLTNDGSSLRSIAQQLNTESIPTRRNKQWTPMTVKRVLERANRCVNGAAK